MSYYQQQPPRHQLPVPGMRRRVGLGDVIAGMTKAVGIKPCEPCKRRQEALNRWLQFGPGGPYEEAPR